MCVQFSARELEMRIGAAQFENRSTQILRQDSKQESEKKHSSGLSAASHGARTRTRPASNEGAGENPVTLTSQPLETRVPCELWAENGWGRYKYSM